MLLNVNVRRLTNGIMTLILKGEKKMEPGTQIAYIPLHAEGDINHPDVEFGFVTLEKHDCHFCRYWRKGHLGELRTVANSEYTPTAMLVEHISVPQDLVDAFFKKVGEDG
jgi:hypothetical protein